MPVILQSKQILYGQRNTDTGNRERKGKKADRYTQNHSTAAEIQVEEASRRQPIAQNKCRKPAEMISQFIFIKKTGLTPVSDHMDNGQNQNQCTKDNSVFAECRKIMPADIRHQLFDDNP